VARLERQHRSVADERRHGVIGRRLSQADGPVKPRGECPAPALAAKSINYANAPWYNLVPQLDTLTALITYAPTAAQVDALPMLIDGAGKAPRQAALSSAAAASLLTFKLGGHRAVIERRRAINDVCRWILESSTIGFFSEGAYAWARQNMGSAERVVALYSADTKYQFRTDLPPMAEVMSIAQCPPGRWHLVARHVVRPISVSRRNRLGPANPAPISKS
jgi:hypothetical protein